MDLHGKTVIITGASRGIGAGLAHAFHAQGANLGLCARGPAALPEGPGVVTAQFDVVDEEAMVAFVKRVETAFGSIDLFVNNAGILEPIAPIRDVSVGEFQRNLEVNVVGVFLGTRAYIRHLRALGHRGVLINISSGAARRGFHSWAAYCASKAAVDLLTETVQLEESEYLRAYAVAPGVIDTDMQSLIREKPASVFPDVDYFIGLKRDDGFSSVAHVAREVSRLAFDPSYPATEVRTSFEFGQ